MNDLQIARKYLNKASNARQAGHAFNLSFTSFKNMMKAKRCYYLGIELTDSFTCEIGPTDRTIDRIDSSKGYVSGNVVACSHMANQIKGTIECGTNGWSIETVKKIVSKIEG